MKKYLFFAFPLVFLMACGSKEAAKVREIVKLESFKDKLSYALGAEHAKILLESGDPNLASYDNSLISKGFSEGLQSSTFVDQDCQNTLRKLYGPQNQDFDTNYREAGCVCTGKYLGSLFTKHWKNSGGWAHLDIAMVKNGLRDALDKGDTILKKEERIELINNFVIDLNRKNGAAMMEKAKKLPNIQTMPSGLIIQTLVAGTGGSPAGTDDVQADYILTSASGDTIQSSFDMKKQYGKEAPAFNLAGGLIQGWKDAFPLLKKGGKYRLFIPAELAYGAQKGYESLCFYIEFNNYGKAGSLVKEEPGGTRQQ
jgi:FKBP-type peptidyl-prolyl cis-trans isomerase FkpA